MWQSWLDSFCKRAVHQHLARIAAGRITLVDGGRKLTFGEPAQPLEATLTVRNERFYRRVALGGGLGAAESLMDGDWTCDDLTSLIRIFIRNSQVATGLDGGFAWLAQSLARVQQWLEPNNERNVRSQIHRHYDLGNDFFGLLLDDTLSYSSAWFPHDGASLREASVAKIDRVCRKLDLQPDDHVLEIGTGWGALAVQAAENYGCRITSTTISAEQFRLARERVSQAGLTDRIDIQQRDYRQLRGSYDKLISIEMIEAVGERYLDTYFRQCSQLLRPDGAMVLQAIVIRDQMLERHRSSVDFIGKYIFPGGFLPSVSLIGDCVTRSTDLRICHLEEMSEHYLRTLEMWREKFWQNIEQVRAQGFDEPFIRMWDYYLQYCAAAFAERQVNVVQVLLGKPGYRGPAIDPQPRLRTVPLEGLRPRVCQTSLEQV